MTYVRRKWVGNRRYVGEAAKVRAAGGRWTEVLIRYIGPEDPRYGGKGPVDAQAERAKLLDRNRRRLVG